MPLVCYLDKPGVTDILVVLEEERLQNPPVPIVALLALAEPHVAGWHGAEFRRQWHVIASESGRILKSMFLIATGSEKRLLLTQGCLIMVSGRVVGEGSSSQNSGLGS